MDRTRGAGFLTGAILCAGLVLGAAAQTTDEALDPERPWANEADQLLAAGKAEAALRLYEKLTLTHADDAPLWLRIAMVHLSAGRAGAGLEAAQTAFDLEPDADAHLVLAQCQVATGDAEKGIATLERGVERFPQNLELLEALAMVSLGREEWARAGGLLRELVRLDPANPDYRMDLARILINSNDPAGAEEQLDVFLQARPESPTGHALLGRAVLLEGRLAEAREHFEASLALRETAEAHAGLGAVAFVSGDFDSAVSHLETARALDPRDADVLFNLGNAYVQNGDVDGAISAYRASIELDPQAATSHANLGVLLLNLLQVAEARRHLERAATLDPSLPEPHLHLARIAAAEFEYENALAAYRAYQERVDDPAEIERIAQVLANLEKKAEAARQAKARGEIHLLQLMVSSRETAEEIVRRVENGEDFYTLAEKNSQLAEVAGIDAGFLDPRTLNETFRGSILALEVGEMTEILSGANGYYVFMRVE